MNTRYSVSGTVLHAAVSAGEMLLGTALTAAAFGLVVLPMGFASAGVTGLASVTAGYTPFTITQLVYAVNMLFLGVGFFCVGKAFAVRTVASSLLFPVFLQMFSGSSIRFSGPPLTGILFAGVLLGAGTGLLLHSGASSGGFAILGVLLEKKHRIPVAVTLNITDAAIILLQAFRQPLAQTVCGILTVTLSAMLVGVMTTVRTDPQKLLHRLYPAEKAAQ